MDIACKLSQWKWVYLDSNVANIERSFKTINQIVIKAKSMFIGIVVKFHSVAGVTQVSKLSKNFLSYKAT